ncbi:MAG: Dna2/Cas4 domain-containing protein [Lysobacterales bacterium]|nr:MAG: Dna2/Cas4 domain-containing protein [Xanthomonadales bacterium]
MIDIPNIVKALENKAAEKIKRRPCHVNRASSLGYFTPAVGGCVRRGVYERTHWQEKELHDVGLQLIFDEGNNQEELVLRDMRAAGFTIAEQQTMYEFKEYQISGHIDGKLIINNGDEPVAIPIEIKSMSPNIFDGIQTFEDFKKKPWTRAYMVQIAIYMLLQEIDEAIFILKNKSTGEIKQVNVQFDKDLTDDALAAAKAINEHVAAGTLPDGTQNIDTCKKCPFKVVCKPQLNFGVELRVEDDPDMERKIDRYLELKVDAQECDDLWKDSIQPKMKASAVAQGGELKLLLGKYSLKGSIDSRGAFRGHSITKV